MMQKINQYISTLSASIVMMVLMLCVTAGGRASAQEVQFEIKTPLVVTKGEQFRVEFVAVSPSGFDVEKFIEPAFSVNINVLMGPTKSTGRSMSSRNGVTQSSSSITYAYYVQAVNVGEINISAATVTVAGRKYNSKATTVECVAADQSANSSRGQQRGGNSSSGAAKQSKTRVEKGDILLRMDVNKRDVYRGEPIVASLKLYTQLSIAGLENPKYPALNGFWAQELDVSGQSAVRATVGGLAYDSHILRQWLLYPQRSGTIEMEQAQFTAIAQLVTQAENTGSPYDLFYGGAPQVKNVPVKLSSPVVKINVKELPKPQPADFMGAVGKFDLTGVITGDRFSANTAGAITVRLSGTGNFPLIEAPVITFPAAFEQFDMKSTERLTNTSRGTSGERTYEFPFIARAEGKYTIEGVQFSYFNPATGKYATLKTEDFDIEILRDESGGSGTQGMGMISGVTKEDLKMLGQDIRFIRTGNPELVREGRAFLWSATWFVMVILLMIAFAGLLFFLRLRIKERADLVRVKTKKANKMALRRLKRAKGYMIGNKETPFFEEMLRALWGYMGDKLDIDVANLTKERVLTELVDGRGVQEEQAREFMSLISECEFAQYSPAAGIQMEKAYNAALDLIGRLDSKILTRNIDKRL